MVHRVELFEEAMAEAPPPDDTAPEVLSPPRPPGAEAPRQRRAPAGARPTPRQGAGAPAGAGPRHPPRPRRLRRRRRPAWPRLDAPAEVGLEEVFDVVVGLRADHDETTTGTGVLAVPVADFLLDVELVGGDFETVDGPRRISVRVTLAAYPERTFRVRPSAAAGLPAHRRLATILWSTVSTGATWSGRWWSEEPVPCPVSRRRRRTTSRWWTFAPPASRRRRGLGPAGRRHPARHQGRLRGEPRPLVDGELASPQRDPRRRGATHAA